jgi:thiol-disulfide isomerase/thioredoxin
MGRQATIFVAVIIVIALVSLFWPRGDGSFEAPAGSLTDGAGRSQTLGERMAPVTLVHFWATWCPPCITEIPTLTDLTDDMAVHPEFRVLMVAVQDEVTKVRTFLGGDAEGVLYDPTWEVAHRYGTRQLPETYLVVNGRVQQKWEGAQDWNDPELRRTVAEAMREVGVQLTTTQAAR